MADVHLPDTSELPTANADFTIDHGEESDDDGLGGYATAESYDDMYLNASDAARQEETTSRAEELKILHSSGDCKMKPELFVSRTTASDFDASQALGMFQRRFTMDYGQRSSGSKPASKDDEYYPIFHLDMISVVGCPLRSITNRSAFFDNVNFTLQNWQAPYSSKHAASSLPFDLAYRTFRLATGASRELWFVVMHPIETEILELPQSRAERRRRQKESGQRSALKKHHAEAMATYVKEVFLDGELLGEGVELSWNLGDRRSQNMSFEKWSVFQTLFMERWSSFIEAHAYDPFWAEHQPAFHAYDHGANIQIEVNGPLERLPQEERLRNDEDESDSESQSDGEDDDNAPRGAGSVANDDGPSDETTGNEDTHRALYSDGLEQLRKELEQKYNLDHIERVSYALAADINCLESAAEDEEEVFRQDKEALCLLADRSQVAAEYGSARDFTFYPLAFHPRYGNFSSGGPPQFLNNLCTIMRNNMSVQNDGIDVLSFGFFQGYSNIKRSIRSRPDDLLATRGIATAALTLPPSETKRSPAHIRAKQEKLLRRLRGELTPEQPESSTPFARERHRIEAAMAQEQVAFRMEQVVTVRASKLVPGRRNFFSVLQPIFQLMRFFLRDTGSYTSVLRSFKPSVFPNVLCSFARLFELALAEMERRFRARGDEGLDLALSEGIAVLDRLGNFCFTGDPRVLPSTVLGPLVTMESLRKGAWPFVSPAMLDFREPTGTMNVTRWPRTADNRPILLHVAALAYHYGTVVAANRHSQVWFGQLGGKAIRDIRVAVRFMEEVFRGLWIPQMVAFMTYQFRRQLNRNVRSGKPPAEHLQQSERINAALASWEASDEPFSSREHERLFAGIVPDESADSTSSISISNKARQDFAGEIYEACCSPKETAGQAISSTHGTWFLVLRGAVQHTSEKDVSSADWVAGLATAMASTCVEWAPGSHRNRLTSRRIIRLVGVAKPKQFITARPGSLKRQAMEAEYRMQLEEQQPKRQRRRVINFGCAIPFETIPKILQDGFASLDKWFESGDQGILNHYQAARNCLVKCLGDPMCDLMLMLALTMAASSLTPEVKQNVRGFGVRAKRKNPEQLAATLVTRMLWYLRPEDFPWEKDERGVLCVKEMTKKIEQTGANNRMLREMGWIEVKGNRPNPRNSDSKLRSEEELYSMRKDLMHSRKHPDAFIAMVFKSDDKVWVDRCASIIKDR